MSSKRSVVKIIDYVFQNEGQLTEAWDDSNSMRYLSEFDITVVGRLNTPRPVTHLVEGTGYKYKVIFFPVGVSVPDIAHVITNMKPNVIHMHGNHGWPSFPVYAGLFAAMNPRPYMIFSPAGTSCGTEGFLDYFDKIIVNHEMQIPRMRCNPYKVVVRRRAADPAIFHPLNMHKSAELIYVAGFVPQKRIDLMIDFSTSANLRLMVLGDFSRTPEHYGQIRQLALNYPIGNVQLCDFVRQQRVAEVLSLASIFTWPNIKPENPETTTNRSVIEALACGMPMLVGERAFKNTEFVVEGVNGFTYSGKGDFLEKAWTILRNREEFSQGSTDLNRKNHDFRTHFVDFYRDLYSHGNTT